MQPARLLLLCTGNVCRSAAAERLLQDGLEARLGRGADEILVRSAGLGCPDGWPVDPAVGALLDAAGSSGWHDMRSTAVTDELVTGASLILTADRGHRLRVGERWPAAYRQTFTFGEAAHLLPGAPVPEGTNAAERVRWLADWLADERSVRQVPGGLDLADPHGGKDAEYAEMMARLQPMVTTILDALAPRASSGKVSP